MRLVVDNQNSRAHAACPTRISISPRYNRKVDVEDQLAQIHVQDGPYIREPQLFQRYQWSNRRGWVKLAFADQILRNDVHFCLFVSRSSDNASRKSAKRRDLTSV